MDITEQTEYEKQAVIRTNMRNAIKRVRSLRAEADSLVKQLKSGLEGVKEACGDAYEAFQKAIGDL